MCLIRDKNVVPVHAVPAGLQVLLESFFRLIELNLDIFETGVNQGNCVLSPDHIAGVVFSIIKYDYDIAGM